MFHNRNATTHLRIESLESRSMMAGNVIAHLAPDRFGTDSILVVEGDNQANQIRIVQDTGGHARIEGLAGTTVNGMAADEVFFAGSQFSQVQVRLGNGDDNLAYEFAGDSTLPAILIDMGRGDDTVTVLAHTMSRLLQIDTGQGDDNVTMDMDLTPGSFFLVAHYSIQTGLGDDTVLIRANGLDVGPIYLFDDLD